MDIRAVILGGCLAAVPLGASAELWPGQGPGKGYISFTNGARGVVTSLGPSTATVDYYNPRTGVAETMNLASKRGQTGTALILRPARSRLTSFLSSAARIGSPLSVLASVALTGDELADGSACGAYGSGQVRDFCENVADVEPCIAVSGGFGQRSWLGYTPCFASYNQGPWVASTSTDTSVRIYWTNFQQPAGQSLQGVTNYYSYDFYPSKAGTFAAGYHGQPLSSWREKFAERGTGIHPCLSDPAVTCPDLPDFDDVLEEKIEPGGFPELHGENRFLADVWEPLPLPAGLEDATPQEMNPGGQLVEDPTTMTTPDNAVDPWPVVASTVTSTGTITTNEDGSQTVQTEVQQACGAPGQPICSVEVTNQPEFVAPELEDVQIPVNTIDVSELSPGGKWLPDACPPPLEIPLLGQTLTLDNSAACMVFGWLGIVVQALGALTAALIVIRGGNS